MKRQMDSKAQALIPHCPAPPGHHCPLTLCNTLQFAQLGEWDQSSGAQTLLCKQEPRHINHIQDPEMSLSVLTQVMTHSPSSMKILASASSR